MKYDKPEVVKVANAAYAIQSGEKQGLGSDSDPNPNFQTNAAYEADE